MSQQATFVGSFTYHSLFNSEIQVLPAPERSHKRQQQNMIMPLRDQVHNLFIYVNGGDWLPGYSSPPSFSL